MGFTLTVDVFARYLRSPGGGAGGQRCRAVCAVTSVARALARPGVEPTGGGWVRAMVFAQEPKRRSGGCTGVHRKLRNAASGAE